MVDEGDTRPPDVITRAMERVYVSMTDADSEGGRLALVESVRTLESLRIAASITYSRRLEASAVPRPQQAVAAALILTRLLQAGAEIELAPAPAAGWRAVQVTVILCGRM